MSLYFSISARILRGLQRIRIGDDPHAFDERIPKRDGAAEAVEKRQRGEDGSRPSWRSSMALKLRDVAEDVAMAQDDALRIAGAAAGEEEHGFARVPLRAESRAAGRECPPADRSPPSTRERSGASSRQQFVELAATFSGQGKSVKRCMNALAREMATFRPRARLRTLERGASAGEIQSDRALCPASTTARLATTAALARRARRWRFVFRSGNVLRRCRLSAAAAPSSFPRLNC